LPPERCLRVIFFYCRFRPLLRFSPARCRVTDAFDEVDAALPSPIYVQKIVTFRHAACHAYFACRLRYGHNHIIATYGFSATRCRAWRERRQRERRRRSRAMA